MREMMQFYINGEWVDPHTPNPLDVINPATEEPCGRISMGSVEDVNDAVAAAKAASESFAASSRELRMELLQAILDGLLERSEEMATVIMEEMGAPWSAERTAAFQGSVESPPGL